MVFVEIQLPMIRSLPLSYLKHVNDQAIPQVFLTEKCYRQDIVDDVEFD